MRKLQYIAELERSVQMLQVSDCSSFFLEEGDEFCASHFSRRTSCITGRKFGIVITASVFRSAEPYVELGEQNTAATTGLSFARASLEMS